MRKSTWHDSYSRQHSIKPQRGFNLPHCGCFGHKKIYLCGITPTPVDRFGRPNKELVKVALGAEKYCEWEHVPKTYILLDKLKQDGYTIYALEQAKNAYSLKKIHLSKTMQTKSALVVGNEVKGLSKTIQKRADYIIEIPMLGIKESLNVAVSFGIATYSLINNH
ncbi:hypothetical protein BK004_03630 [bacterium CG10_46_32]|nr:MAG: hypothetical protein BK004_03630 [bacterium CG10_46_32]PIR55889.1 MAG: RNA methyltransferase [Parcubacteria group bacterium CG10_big_fil_rev_8_21_14_0_10_46_32]